MVKVRNEWKNTVSSEVQDVCKVTVILMLIGLTYVRTRPKPQSIFDWARISSDIA